MRVVNEITLPNLKITIFNWNNKYLIKLEDGPFEQTFKLDELDILESDINKIFDSEFIDEAIKRFKDMANSLYKSMQRNDCL
jgi:hypothetical protein